MPFLFFPAVWVCTAALAILDRLDVVDVPTLGWWLAERQLPNGGLNGRPEKLEDVHNIKTYIPSVAHADPSPIAKQVCYSYWVLSSMAILNKLTWIDSSALTRFILSAQVCGKPTLVRPSELIHVRTPRVGASRTGQVTW